LRRGIVVTARCDETSREDCHNCQVGAHVTGRYLAASSVAWLRLKSPRIAQSMGGHAARTSGGPTAAMVGRSRQRPWSSRRSVAGVLAGRCGGAEVVAERGRARSRTLGGARCHPVEDQEAAAKGRGIKRQPLDRLLDTVAA
jgi:hypothetical protein